MGQAFLARGFAVYIFDEALGGILAGEEVKALEEVRGVVCRLELVSSLSSCGSNQYGTTDGRQAIREAHLVRSVGCSKRVKE